MIPDVLPILDSVFDNEPVIERAGYSSLYPSEASIERADGSKAGTCMRKAYLRFKKQKEDDGTLDAFYTPPDHRAHWTFGQGHAIEAMVIERAKLAGIYYSSKNRFRIPIVDGIAISGEIDAIFMVGDKLVGIEVKSSSGYWTGKEVINDGGRPKIDHLLQTALYAWVTRSKIDAFKLIYIMRDSSKRKEFNIALKAFDDPETTHPDESFEIVVDGSRTELTINQILTRYRDLADHIIQGSVPEREYDLRYDDGKMDERCNAGLLSKTLTARWTKYVEAKAQGKSLCKPQKGDWQCSYCSWSTYCYKDLKTGTERDSIET